MENLLDENQSQPLITYPESDDDIRMKIDAKSCLPISANELMMNGTPMTNGTNVNTVNFEQSQTTSQTKSKVVVDGISTEEETMNSEHRKNLQAGDLEIKEAISVAARRNRLEAGDTKAETNDASIKVSCFLKWG